MVIPEHTITCIPTLALQTTSDPKLLQSTDQSFVTGKRQTVVWGYSASVEHQRNNFISIATKHAETRSEP
jgi:hypothetical protein